ncbi:MAG: hypothetical protein LIO96_05115, partial [Lachnospiraceae bacterium]|nr:hypothetical protein [Lachnospiraceae bacterium]
KSLVKIFREYGCSERKTRDYAIIVAVLQQVARQEREDARYMITYPAERREEILPEVTVEESVQAEIRIRENAERELRQARKENQACRHEIRILQQEIERLKGRIAKKEQREDASGETAEEDAREKTGTAAADAVQYPYRTNLRVVLYGGFEEFHRKLLKYLPDVRVVSPSAHIDINPFRNADIVFLQINKTDHSGYWTVCDACKSSGVPYLHLNYASAKRCAEMMVDQIRKMERKDRALCEGGFSENGGNR